MQQSVVPLRRTWQLRLRWLGYGGLLVAVALIAGLARYHIGESRPAPANPDQALVDAVEAAVSGAADEAQLAALYAPAAILRDTVVEETSIGLPAIEERIARLAGLDFMSIAVSAPFRHGDLVLWFEKHGTRRRPSYPGLIVVKLDPSDGRILHQWVYSAPQWMDPTP